MSVFSNQLQALFQQTGLSVYAMSKACGVERTFLHKILNGTRLPASETVVERIAQAMCLRDEEAQQLYRQYQICRDGEETWERRRAVNELLTGMSLPSRESRFVVRRQVDVEALPHVASDRVTVLRLIQLLLDVEVSQPGGRIELLCTSEDEFLWRLLGMYVDNRPDLPVVQAVYLQNGGTRQALLHNLGLLRHVLPLALSSAGYRAMVCYGGPGRPLLLSNLLLTSRYALQFSDGFSHAVLLDDAERVGLLQSLLDRQIKGCRPLIRQMKHPLELLEHYGGINEQLEAGQQIRLYTLGPEPCVTPFYTQALLDAHLSPELRTPERLRLLLDYSAQARRMTERCQVTHYFTPAGVERFVNSGRLTELPDSFYTPFSPEECREMLGRQVRLAEAFPNYTPLALDTQKLPMPENIILESAVNGTLSLIYAHPEAGFLAFVLDEPMLCNALFDYLEGLKQSRFVMSREESLSLLRRAAGEEEAVM